MCQEVINTSGRAVIMHFSGINETHLLLRAYGNFLVQHSRVIVPCPSGRWQLMRSQWELSILNYMKRKHLSVHIFTIGHIVQHLPYPCSFSQQYADVSAAVKHKTWTNCLKRKLRRSEVIVGTATRKCGADVKSSKVCCSWHLCAFALLQGWTQMGRGPASYFRRAGFRILIRKPVILTDILNYTDGMKQ
jgi:hypothetical protein